MEVLRRDLPAPEARTAAALHTLRNRARGRLRSADRLALTAEALEQATPRAVAAARAFRIAARADGRWILDATAGIGGDAMELAARGLTVIAGERDVVRAGCLAHNLRAAREPDAATAAPLAVRCDATRPPIADPATGLVVLDPDRRLGARAASGGRGRAGDPAAWEPTLDATLRLAGRFAGAVVKLPPALDPAEVAGAMPGRWQWVSLRGELKELALWTGCLAEEGADREATSLAADGTASRLVGTPVEIAPLEDEAARAARFLAEPDPAVIRAGLLGRLAGRVGMRPVHAEIAYLGGETAPEVAAGDAGLLSVYRVLAGTPADPKRVRRMLTEHDVGPVTVKKRGHPDGADKLAKRLRGGGRSRGLLIIARLEAHHHAWLVEPIAPRAS